MKNTVSAPMINRLSLDLLYEDTPTPAYYNDIPQTPYVPINYTAPAEADRSGLDFNSGGRFGDDKKPKELTLDELLNLKSTDKHFAPSLALTRDELKDKTGRYAHYLPGTDNEDAYGQNQAFTTKAFNGVTKGLALTATTFLQTTVGSVNGLYQWGATGRFASFYDNEMNRTLDGLNKNLENKLATYDTKEFREAKWYSPDYLLTGNFLFEGVVKNLGFAAGAALSGMAYSSVFNALTKATRLLSVGKSVEAIAKAESAIARSATATKNLGELKSMSDKFINSYNLLTPGGRAVVAGLATTGESGIEAFHNLNEWRDNAIAEYVDLHGFEPIGDDLKKINENADDLGNYSMLLNTILLSATNYIQFPKIIGSSFQAEKQMANGLARTIKPIVKEGEKYVEKAAFGGARFNKVRRAVQNPYVFSYSEAFEEGSQFAIGEATKHYYNKKYNDEDTSWLHDVIDSGVAGYKEVLTNQGMKEVVIGGLSGALMLANGKYKQRNKLNADTAAALGSGTASPGLNTAKLSDFTKDTFDSVQRGITLQKQQEEFVKQGDVLETKDIEADYMINYLAPRIKYGRYDLVAEDIKEMQQLASTEGGFEQLQKEGKAQATDTKEAFLARLDGFKATAENVKSLYQSLNMRYGGQVDEKGERLYSDQVIDKLVYAASKIADYDTRISQLKSKVPLDVMADIDDAIDKAILLNNAPIEAIEAKINANTNITSTQKEEQVAAIYDLASMAVRRQHFLQEYDEMKSSPQQFNTAEPVQVDPDAPKETIKVKTKKGEIDVTTNTEYYLLEDITDIETSRKPRKLTILKENEDGTMQVQYDNGEVENITKDAWSKMNVGSVEATTANAKANYVIENIDSLFTHNGIKVPTGRFDKDGKPIMEGAKGRLEYTNKNNALIFVYKDAKGNLKRREVLNTMFTAQKGFKQPMIRRAGKATAKQQASEDRFVKAKLTMSERLEKRNAIVQSLYDKTLAKLTAVNNKLQASSDRLKNIPQEIEDAYNTKAGKRRVRITAPITKLVKELTKLKETLPDDIALMEESKEHLENQIELLKEFLSDMDTMPQVNTEFIKVLKDDIQDIDEMIELSAESMEKAEKQKTLVEALYQSAMELYQDLVKRLKEENPGIPMSLEAFTENIEKFLGVEGAKNMISERLGFTNTVLEMENALLEFEGDLKIPALSKKAEMLERDIKELAEGLDALIEEQIAKQAILESFEEAANEQKLKDEEERILRDDEGIRKDLLATEDKQGETLSFSDNYNPQALKAVNILPVATMAAGDGKAHQERANTFGINLAQMKEDGKDIKGVYITQKNEGTLAPGLIDHLRTNEKNELMEDIDPKETIVLLMVIETSDGLRAVDVNGEPLADDADVNALGIYQVTPLPAFQYGTAGKNNSMFREGTSDEAKAQITEKYVAWRKTIKASDEANTVVDVEASMGKVVNEVDENRVPIGENPVTSAGFISDIDLEKKAVIKIPTAEKELSKGTTSFLAPFKRVFLETINGYVKLNNRRHSPEQAETIFKAIHALAREIVEDPEAAKSPKAKRYLRYLQGVTYWGIPTYQTNKKKESIGYSSVFFEVDKESGHLVLFVGKKNRYVFAPSHLENRREEIIADLERLYSNTNNAFTKKGKNGFSDFEEITDIDSKGNITSIVWPNYQTYLLSDKMPDESGAISDKSKPRSSDKIPLTTHARALSTKEPENRVGIYFYAKENEKLFKFKEKKQISMNFKDKPNSKPGSTPKAKAKPTGEMTVKQMFDTLPVGVKNEIMALPKEKRDAIIKTAYTRLKELADQAGEPLDNKSYEELLDEAEALIPGTKDVFMNAVNNGVITEDKVLDMAKLALKNVKARMAESGAVPDLMDQSAIDLEADREFAEQEDNDDSAEDTEQAGYDKFNDFVGNTFEEDSDDPSDDDADDLLGAATANDIPDSKKGKAVLPKPAGKVTSPALALKARQAAKLAQGKPTGKGGNKSAFRPAIFTSRKYVIENWNTVEAFLKRNLPNIPIYRVKNLIEQTNGAKNFGMFQDAALYVYQNAEAGTAYHEVFHAVWRLFTPVAEQEQIFKEFRNRKGTFLDVATQTQIEYSKATDLEAEERMSEEFRNYVQKREIPLKPSDGRPYILKMFSDLVNFVKSVFLKKDSAFTLEKMFKDITKGKYRDSISPYAQGLSYAEKGIIDIEDAIPNENAVFSKLPGITDTEMNDIVQSMLYDTLVQFMEEDSSLFSKKSISLKNLNLQEGVLANLEEAEYELFESNNEGFMDDVELQQSIDYLDNLRDSIVREWPSVFKLFSSRVLAFDLQIDENDDVQTTSEDKIKNSDYVDATKVDSLKKMNSALKLVLSTVPIVDEMEQVIPSSVYGVSLLSFNQVSKTLMQALHNSINPSDMVERFRKLAEKDPNYRKLYTRFTQNSWQEENAGYTNIKSMQQFILLSALWKSFSLQAPSVKNVFILENGDTQVGDAALSSSAMQLRTKYLNAVTLRAKTGKGFYTFNPQSNTFTTNQVKLSKFPLSNNNTSRHLFLKELGIDMTVAEMMALSPNQTKHFREALAGIRESIYTSKPIYSFSGKNLDLHKRLLQIGLIQSSALNPEHETTYFNVAGERSQTYIGSNVHSRLYKIISQVKNKLDLKETQYDYLLSDVFSQGSIIMSKLFSSDGSASEANIDGENYLQTGIAGGTINESKNKNKSSSNLTYKERLLQEINLNIEGWYLNLVPGDSSTEWMTFMGNHVTSAQMDRGMKSVYDIFQQYFIAEVNLSRDGRSFVQNVDKTRKASDLRFFKGILGKALHTQITKSTASPDLMYRKHQKSIEDALDAYFEQQATKVENALDRYGIAEKVLGAVKLDGIASKEGMSAREYKAFLKLTSVNYAIANIEMHKLIYSDPYQYKDQLKRTKSSNSPRQEILNSDAELNELMGEIWNKNFEEGEIGHTNFERDFFRTVTLTDVEVVNEFKKYGAWKETDGGGIIGFKSYRNFRIRASDWSEDNERQYRYDTVWEKNDKGMVLKPLEKLILDAGNPSIKDTYTSLKPIVTGNRFDGQNYNDIVVDKYALFPLSYRIAKEFGADNSVTLSNKMAAEDIDYVVFNSGRKVGAHSAYNPYKAEGGMNDALYDDIVNIPFAIIGNQVEIPSSDTNSTTRGSQVTKMVTMDKMDAGVPIDFSIGMTLVSRLKQWSNLSEQEKLEASPLYKEIANNRNLLNSLTEDGYKTILDKLGIVESSKGFVFGKDGIAKLIETLKQEVLTRSANDNIIEALESFLEETTVLEATPAYYQISNILYSIVDKQIVHAKMNGGMKVQMPSTFWEKNRLGIQEINGKKGYTSDVLDFYSENVIDKETGEKGSINVMEIFIGRWFNSSMSDVDLLNYLNNTKEGQNILRGFAYRIPTQNGNSIDAFKIKGFLPKEFGDNVVVPSAIVAKVGSDFDIDKLSMYFKNVYSDLKGNPTLVPYWGMGIAAKAKAMVFAEDFLYDELDFKSSKLSKNDFNTKMFADLYLGKELKPAVHAKFTKIFREWFNFDMDTANAVDLYDDNPVRTIEEIFVNRAIKLGKRIDELTDSEKFEEMMDQMGKKLYKESLQNAYMDSNINLITHPMNFDKLTSPNSAQELEDLATQVSDLLGDPAVEYTNQENFLDRMFMSALRHDFVAGKKAIGITALGQTNNALNQQQLIVINTDKIKDQNNEDNMWLTSNKGEISFKNYNSVFIKGKKRATLSFAQNTEKKYISDIVGMFVDGFVDISNGPWIMKLGATPNVVATWLFLIKIGVPLKDVAGFMNQPIIKDYLEKVESSGYSWLYIKDYVDDIKASEKYATKDATEFTTIEESPALFRTIGKNTTKPGEMAPAERKRQHFYLDEFMKYSKMGNQLFMVTQGSSYDTANFNNPYLLFKKQIQFERAQNSILSSVDGKDNMTPAIDAMLKNTFLSQTKESLEMSREALSIILLSDAPNVREVMHKLLAPYVNKSDRDFVEIAKKAVTGLFDWAVQNAEVSKNVKLNAYIKDVLVSDDNVSRELNAFVKNVKRDPAHPLFDNEVIKLFEAVPSRKAEKGGTDNIKIRSIGTETYDQNKLIYAFRELKQHLIDEGNKYLYDRIVMQAVLQSGLATSSVSYTSSIPFEDFSRVYNSTMTLLDTMPDLDSYAVLGAFERNHWNNTDIIPTDRARFIDTKTGKKIYNPGMEFLPDSVQKAVDEGTLPPILSLGVGFNTDGASHVTYTWEKHFELLTKEDKAFIEKSGQTESKFLIAKKQKMKEAGDYSYLNKALFEKVLDPLTKEPIPHFYDPNDGSPVRWYYIYKAINAWGNGNMANEYYDVAKQSVINNGYMKVNEASNESVIDVFYEKPQYRKSSVITKKNKSAPKSKGEKTVKGKNPNSTMNLEGKTYKYSEINSALLLSLGYKDEAEMGAILKKIC